jgi:hypothetical protein
MSDVYYIYCFRSPQTNSEYIGSTRGRLETTLKFYKTLYDNYMNMERGYHQSFKILQYGDCYVELITKCKVNSKKELNKKVSYYKKEMGQY